MDTSQVAMHQSITFLAYVTGFFAILVGGFLVKLIIDLSGLAKNIDATTTVIRTELQPTIVELNESLHLLNEFMKSTDDGIDKVKNTVGEFLGISANAFTKAKALSGSLAKGVLKGFSSVMGVFCKK